MQQLPVLLSILIHRTYLVRRICTHLKFFATQLWFQSYYAAVPRGRNRRIKRCTPSSVRPHRSSDFPQI